MATNKAQILCTTVAFLASWSCAWGQSSLPPTVQADLLNQDIVSAYGSGRLSDIPPLLDQYYALGKLGIDVPSPIRLLEVRLAMQAGARNRAMCSLEGYFSRAERTDAGYQEALAIYKDLKPTISAESLDATEQRFCADRSRTPSSSGASENVSQPPTTAIATAAAVTFYRKLEFDGSKDVFSIREGSDPPVTIRSGESFTVDLTPGDHEFAMQVISDPGAAKAVLKISAASGNAYFVKAFAVFGWHAKPRLLLTDKATFEETPLSRSR